jgi:hypothetical protein
VTPTPAPVARDVSEALHPTHRAGVAASHAVVAQLTAGPAVAGGKTLRTPTMQAMGFWGTFLVARSDRPLPELDGVRELAEHLGWHGVGRDGWQAVQLHRAPRHWQLPMTGTDGREQLLESLQSQTGWPVLAGIVAASDGAQVIGYSPRAGRWSGWLMLETLVGYLGSPYTDCLAVEEDEELPDDDEFWQDRYREACRPLYELAPPPGIAAPRAVAWAKEAGCAPGFVRVRRHQLFARIDTGWLRPGSMFASFDTTGFGVVVGGPIVYLAGCGW